MTIGKINSASIKSFFSNLVHTSFLDLGKDKDKDAAGYLIDMLTEFARTDNLYKLHDSEGKKIQTIVEILLESKNSPVDNAGYEREVRKYVGDFALFMSGIFREYVSRGSYLRYYMSEGMKSYFVVSQLDLERGEGNPIMFSKLAREFEFYSGALDYMRKVYFGPDKTGDPFRNFAVQISRIRH
ncbi:MAG: hypothetical protein ACHQ6U_06190 [Thermodesulfobacteriota bacterium]